MRIFYAGNFNNVNAEYISKTLESMGHEVKRRNEDHTTVDWVLKHIEEEQYDFMLCEEARFKGDYIYGVGDGQKDKVKGRLIEIMDKILVVPWLTNLIQNIPERSYLLEDNPVFKAPRVFTTDGGLKRDNVFCLRQGVYDRDAVMSKEESQYRVGFVGEDNQRFWPYRKQLIKFLKDNYDSLRLAGHGRDRYYGLELNKLLGSIDIIVGDSVYSPNYWSNRVYEVIGRGGFLIMPDIPGLDEEFTPFKHYVPYEFNNFDDLRKKIDYYLTHKDEREYIRQEGFEYCKENYTYKQRLEVIIDYVRRTRDTKS